MIIVGSGVGDAFEKASDFGSPSQEGAATCLQHFSSKIGRNKYILLLETGDMLRAWGA